LFLSSAFRYPFAPPDRSRTKTSISPVEIANLMFSGARHAAQEDLPMQPAREQKVPFEILYLPEAGGRASPARGRPRKDPNTLKNAENRRNDFKSSVLKNNPAVSVRLISNQV
jgi:hypothetical protein